MQILKMEGYFWGQKQRTAYSVYGVGLGRLGKMGKMETVKSVNQKRCAR